jgi:hypothetical protein
MSSKHPSASVLLRRANENHQDDEQRRADAAERQTFRRSLGRLAESAIYFDRTYMETSDGEEQPAGKVAPILADRWLEFGRPVVAKWAPDTWEVRLDSWPSRTDEDRAAREIIRLALGQDRRKLVSALSRFWKSEGTVRVRTAQALFFCCAHLLDDTKQRPAGLAGRLSMPSDDQDDATTKPVKISPENRTIPISLRKAARLMGYGDDHTAVKRLRAAVDAGAVVCEKLTRQQFVFDRQDFPHENWSRVIPTGPK